MNENLNLKARRDRETQKAIEEGLHLFKGNVEAVAKYLNTSSRTIWYHMKRLDINRRDFEAKNGEEGEQYETD